VFLAVLIVCVDVPEPPDERVTDVGLSVAAGPCLTIGLIALERLTVPVKPLRLVMVMRDVAEVPARIIRPVGLAAMRKSGVLLPWKLAI